MASTVFPAINAPRCLASRFFAAIWPALVAASGQVISSGANDATTGSAGAGTAAVTSPAPARIAARAAMAGAPALPPAVPNVPPTTSTWPKLPLLAADARGACASASDEPAQSRLSAETIAASGEPMGATTTG